MLRNKSIAALPKTLDKLMRLGLRPKRYVSRLSLRIFAVNMLALLVLAGGLLYVSRYQQELIKGELDSLSRQGKIYASAVGEAARLTSTFLPDDPNGALIIRDVLSKQRTKRLVARLGSISTNRIEVYDTRGSLLGDSDQVPRIGTRYDNSQPHGDDAKADMPMLRFVEEWMDMAVDHIPYTLRLSAYPQEKKGAKFPDVQTALGGEVSSSAWRVKSEDADEPDDIILSAAVPVYHLQQVLGVVHVTSQDNTIAQSLQQIKRDIISLFLVALAVTFILSLYLANSITMPIRRLARGADAVRQGLGSRIQIPDLSRRRDEIGDLSVSLQAMTESMASRIDTISRFAADVAHELKNPLTSLRSAVETLPLVKTDTDRERLTDIILQDVKRLDRLISDISSASRLDADLAREKLGLVDLRLLLQGVAATYAPIEVRLSADAKPTQEAVALELPDDDIMMLVYGIESRLGQVFRNLIDNARSFSPQDVSVRVSCQKLTNPSRWRVMVDDDGPGIPDGKLQAVFDRFYSERPVGEAFGKHSGLGLSICKQIMDAHKGEIYAENRFDLSGTKVGARFVVTLNALG